MSRCVFTAESEADTERLGLALAGLLPDGTTVALIGSLGSGKTRLVQAIAAGFGIDRRDVVSPTFVLVQHYHGRRSLYHFDVYRLRDEAEFLDLGPEEYFESSGITLVEWADRVNDCLPPERVEIRIEPTGPTARRFELLGVGHRHERMISHDLPAALADRATRQKP